MLYLRAFCASVMLAAGIRAATVTSVSQYGITWHFDKAYEAGQFVTGDWWVVGPVVITAVDPAPGAVVEADETARVSYVRTYINNFGDTALRNDFTMRNGSQVNPEWGSKQGYDSGCKNYDASLSATFPLTLPVDGSLVSSISHTSLPNAKLIPMNTEKTYTVLKTAAVLTCLASAPPADAFRPPYSGTAKPIHRASSIRWDRLPQLGATPLMPTVAEAARYVQRPWIDHFSGNWLVQGSAPSENSDSYGRELARMVSIAGLRSMVSTPRDELEPLVYGLIQIGIDIQALREAGAKWYLGGGHGSGRKWPVLYAGVLLDDEAMQTFPANSEFHEDQQTYYGSGWTCATALWQIVHHHGASPLYEHKAPDTWTDTDKRAHSYRMAASGMAWTGQQLGALLLGARQTWNHDAFFDYCDRFMNEQRTVYDGYTVTNLEFMGKAFDNFVNFMYRFYRNTVPVQAGATENMKWIPLEYKWEPDLNAPVVALSDFPRNVLPDKSVSFAPDPVCDRITFNVKGMPGAVCVIYDSCGTPVAELNGPGYHWNPGSAAGRGIYYFVITGSNASVSGEFLKTR